MTRAHSVKKLPMEDEPEEEVDLDMNDSIDDADFEEAINVQGSTNDIDTAVFVLEEDVTTNNTSDTPATSAPELNKSVPNEPQDIPVDEPEPEPSPVRPKVVEAKKDQTREPCTVCGKTLNIKSMKRHKESIHDQKRGRDKSSNSKPAKKQKL